MTHTTHVTSPFPLTDENSRLLGVGERLTGAIYWRTAATTNPDVWLLLDPSSPEYGKEVGDDAGIFYRAMHEDPADAIAKQIGIETEMGKRALKVALSNMKLLDKKQKDYGPANIAAFGEYGVLVRLHDKVARLRNLLTNCKEPNLESIEDSWVDVCNYAAIALLCRRGEWR